MEVDSLLVQIPNTEQIHNEKQLPLKVNKGTMGKKSKKEQESSHQIFRLQTNIFFVPKLRLSDRFLSFVTNCSIRLPKALELQTRTLLIHRNGTSPPWRIPI